MLNSQASDLETAQAMAGYDGSVVSSGATVVSSSVTVVTGGQSCISSTSMCYL